MLAEIGTKLHIVIRRNFADDIRRHFVGEVMYVEGHFARVKGYLFAFNPSLGHFERREELRTKIIDIGTHGHITTILPDEIIIDELDYRMVDKKLCVVCGDTKLLTVSEFGWS